MVCRISLSALTGKGQVVKSLFESFFDTIEAAIRRCFFPVEFPRNGHGLRSFSLSRGRTRTDGEQYKSECRGRCVQCPFRELFEDASRIGDHGS